MTEKVIVVGAGMAGIMAGRTLQEAGFDVVVVEARNRVGGRTHTDHSLGHSVDMGAAWIHGIDGNPLTPLAQELGVAMGYTDFLNRSETAVQAFAEDGTPFDISEYTHGLMLGLAAPYLLAGSELVEQPKAARSFKDIYPSLPKPPNLSHAAKEGFRYHALISTEYVSAADWDQLDIGLSRDYVGLTGGDYLLHGGGFNALTDNLAQGLDVRLETAVSHISYTSTSVALQTTAGEMTCDYVVVTVPLGVLKSGQIEFAPALPEEKTAVIERIGFGSYEKLALRFDKFYWPRDPHRFNYLSTGEPSLFHAWLNIGHYTDEPIIVSYHAHRRARFINQLSDVELVKQTVAVMKRMFGAMPEPVGYVRTNWQGDPYSQGSYSFAQVGQLPTDRRVLAEQVNGRLFFAGEATHSHFYASVHGAYETGIRAAREIIGICRK